MVILTSRYEGYLSYLPTNSTESPFLGCESWTLTKTSLNKIEAFFIRYLHRTFDVRWCDVVDNRIKNVSVRKNFNNIINIDSHIAKKNLSFLGKIIKLPQDKIPSRLISTFATKHRPLGRPNYTIRHSNLKDIEKKIARINKMFFFVHWFM